MSTPRTTVNPTATRTDPDPRCWWRMALGPGYAVGPSGRLIDTIQPRRGRD